MNNNYQERIARLQEEIFTLQKEVSYLEERLLKAQSNLDAFKINFLKYKKSTSEKDQIK